MLPSFAYPLLAAIFADHSAQPAHPAMACFAQKLSEILLRPILGWEERFAGGRVQGVIALGVRHSSTGTDLGAMDVPNMLFTEMRDFAVSDNQAYGAPFKTGKQVGMKEPYD